MDRNYPEFCGPQLLNPTICDEISAEIAKGLLGATNIAIIAIPILLSDKINGNYMEVPRFTV